MNAEIIPVQEGYIIRQGDRVHPTFFKTFEEAKAEQLDIAANELLLRGKANVQ